MFTAVVHWTNSGPGRGGLDIGDRRRGLRSHQKEKSLTGPNPVDRGKKGSKLHVLSDAQGIPLAVAGSGANMHDSLALKPLIRGIPAVRSRRGPGGADPSNSARARRTSPLNTWPGCASAGSSRGPASGGAVGVHPTQQM